MSEERKQMKRYLINTQNNASFITARDIPELMDKFAENLRKVSEDKIDKSNMRYVKQLRTGMRLIKADFKKNFEIKGYWVLDEKKIQIRDWTLYIDSMIKINSFLCLKKGEWVHFCELRDSLNITDSELIGVMGHLVDMGEVEFGYYDFDDPASRSGNQILKANTDLSLLRHLRPEKIGVGFRSSLYLKSFANLGL